jgi:uncharacterized membrane protein HdeD (DUF308 family)
MSSTAIDKSPRGLGYIQTAGRWGWFVALGILLFVLGILALGDVVVTVVSTIFIGAVLVVGGAFQIIHAFANKSWSAFLLNLAAGILYLIGGFLIMGEPLQGSAVITLFLLMALLVGGVLRIVIAVRHREVRGWWMLLLGGLISVALGILLFLSLPWSGFWLLGTLVAIELLVQGAIWVQFGLSLRRLHRAAAGAAF